MREMRWIGAIWTCHFVWVLGYSSLYGYYDEEQELSLVLGMPSWVVIGVVLPWIVATLLTCWFSLARMQDHEFDEVKTRPRIKETKDA